MDKIYIFDTMAQADAFRMVAYYLGHEVTLLGSTITCDQSVYDDVVSKTRAIPAALVAVEDGDR